MEYLDRFFDLGPECSDDTSQNGLQVEGCEKITTIATAVDACIEVFEEAAKIHAQFLIVHHGLFWGKSLTITGIHGQRITSLVKNGISLYAMHLPLDMHPQVGNNSELARMLDLKIEKSFGNYHGIALGIQSTMPQPLPREALAEKIGTLLHTKCEVWPFGPAEVKKIAIVSGGGASEIAWAARKKIDTFLTGEAGHTYYQQAKELKVNVLTAGHYATETVGVKALGDHLHEKFGIEHIFIDKPTGL